MQDRVIVITGASAGIGAALARLIGRKGARPCCWRGGKKR